MQRPPANWPTRYWPWSSVEDKDRTPTAIIAEPFPGAAPPFDSKDEGDDPDEGTLDPKDEDESEETEASFYAWGCDTDTDDPHEHPAAVDHSEDGEARDMSVDAVMLESRLAAFDVCLVGNCVGFMTNALRRTVAEQGITSPVSKLPSAPPGAAEKAKERTKLGRGIEGEGDEGVDPMSTLDKFNWDNLPLPGMGQI